MDLLKKNHGICFTYGMNKANYVARVRSCHLLSFEEREAHLGKFSSSYLLRHPESFLKDELWPSLFFIIFPSFLIFSCFSVFL
jgi:hypothetical protein